MASLSSVSLIFLLFFLFVFSLPTHSQKTQLTRRNIVLLDQDTDPQLIPKPKSNKKTLTDGEEEDQPIPKPKPKKKLLIDKEEEQPITKPKSKKKLLIDEEDQPNLKSNSKKKLQIDEKEDQPISKPKPKKKALIDPQSQDQQEEEDQPIPKSSIKKKTLAFDSKNLTKPIKLKKSNSTSKTLISSTPKSKLNKTVTLKPTNFTKIPNISTKTLNFTKVSKTTKLNSTKTQKPVPKKSKPVNVVDPNPESIWMELSDSDLISEFRELPTRMHQTLLPDIKKISVTSKAYIYKANKNIADNVKPFVGKQFAPKIALAASCIFLILPLCLVTVLFYQLNSYLSLQRFLIFVQAYLAIYFFTLALTALVTGLEPLRFFYATSPSSYAWTQAVQTLGYLLYLLVQLIHLVVVFSAGENKIVVRALGLAQMIVGLAVGCHYYASVFHCAVTGDPPRANWKVHGIYGACFLVICLFARAERTKKAYDGGEDGKKS